LISDSGVYHWKKPFVLFQNKGSSGSFAGKMRLAPGGTSGSNGKRKMTISPRLGLDAGMMVLSANGTLAPYTNLFTSIMSPMRIVLSIEPVGTMNASTTNDRMSSTATITGVHSLTRFFSQRMQLV
jgi:hypothetical protein